MQKKTSTICSLTHTSNQQVEVIMEKSQCHLSFRLQWAATWPIQFNSIQNKRWCQKHQHKSLPMLQLCLVRQKLKCINCFQSNEFSMKKSGIYLFGWYKRWWKIIFNLIDPCDKFDVVGTGVKYAMKMRWQLFASNTENQLLNLFSGGWFASKHGKNNCKRKSVFINQSHPPAAFTH